jgi:RecA-family ATPase
MAKADPPPAVSLPFFNVWTLDGVAIPQQPWSVPDRVPINHSTLFSGEGAAGKSLIMLQLCTSTALGRSWLGITPDPGPTLFIDAEDDTNIIHKRLADILHYHACKFIDLKEKLYVTSLIGQDAVLAAPDRSNGKIERTMLFDKLTEMVGDIKPKIITIASSANVFAGNEIDRSQVQQFVGLLTRLAVLASGSVILISHPSLAGINTDTGLSGSTQWHNAVRARFYIKGKKSEEGEPRESLRVIEFRKNNYGPVSDSIDLEYRNGLFVPIDAATADKARRDSINDDVYLRVAKILLDQHHELSFGARSPTYAPKLISGHPASGTCKTKDLEAAQQRLLDAGKIHIVVTGAPTKPKRTIALGPDPEPTARPDTGSDEGEGEDLPW